MRKLFLSLVLVTLAACTTNIVPTITPSPAISSPTPETSVIPSSVPTTFKKRGYSTTENFFYTKPYPQEVRNQKDSELIGFKCSPEYYLKNPSGNEFGYYDEVAKEQKDLTDITLINSFTSILKTQKLNLPIQTFRSCSLENGKNLVEFQLQNTGGGAGMDSVFAYLSNSNQLDTIVRIGTDPMPYSGCEKILQISATTLFVECGGGDGPGAGSYIHKISIPNHSQKVIYSCEAMAQDESSEPKVICSHE